MIEIIGGLWAAGETKTFHINGEYLEILEAQYPCDVMLMDKSGAQLSVMRSSEASFFSRPKEGFQTVQITSANAQTIRVFIGSGDAGTRRISSTVQVIDGGYVRSNGGQSFMGVAFGQAAAGEGANCQLWNPAGSGRNLAVKKIVTADATGAASIDFVTGSPQLVGNAGSAVVNCKRLGGPASVASVVFRSQAAFVAGSNIMTTNILPNTPFTYDFQEPIIVPPGQGLLVRTGSQQHFILANFDFFEQAI